MNLAQIRELTELSQRILYEGPFTGDDLMTVSARVAELALAAIKTQQVACTHTPDPNDMDYCGRCNLELSGAQSLRAIVENLVHDFDQAVAAHDSSDPRHPSRGGQHTNGPCCPFGNLNPSAVISMKRWVVTMREALDQDP